VYKYFTALLNTTGFDEVLAEELAIIPGMEEVSSLLYINTYARDREYDVILLDCAPTGESLRFVSIPTALEWYIKKVFNLERRMAKLVRPLAKHLTDIPLPQDEYFGALERLFKQLDGVEALLSDPAITTVRLVTNPEKIVIKETQRAFMYFCLYRMCIDAVIINRILPDDVNEHFFDNWKNSQMRYVKRAEEYFSPVPIYEAQLFREEVLGKEALTRLADSIYGDRDPTEIFYRELPYDIEKVDSTYRITAKLPFVGKRDVQINRVGEELIIRVGAFKRSILLPKQAATSDTAKASFNGDKLIVSLGGMEDVR
jgi:arsenite-transporting ATPase